jgi:undecaprenyl-diphosphatase
MPSPEALQAATEVAASSMPWWQAAVLGLVEGLTEYLPVSSTGHLVLTQRALGIAESPAANAYAICIQAGAIVAVLGLYRARLASMLRGLLGRDEQGLGLARALLIAFTPAALLGLLLHDRIEQHLFGLRPIAFAWLAGGVLLLALAQRANSAGPALGGSGAGLETLSSRRALAIGLAQCCALWPGTSRSLATIAGGLFVGLHLAAAVEFSFLLGVLTLCAATVYSAWSDGALLMQEYGASALALGFGSAWCAAVLSVRVLRARLSRGWLQAFGWYRIALAAGTLLYLYAAGGAAGPGGTP